MAHLLHSCGLSASTSKTFFSLQNRRCMISFAVDVKPLNDAERLMYSIYLYANTGLKERCKTGFGKSTCECYLINARTAK